MDLMKKEYFLWYFLLFCCLNILVLEILIWNIWCFKAQAIYISVNEYAYNCSTIFRLVRLIKDGRKYNLLKSFMGEGEGDNFVCSHPNFLQILNFPHFYCTCQCQCHHNGCYYMYCGNRTTVKSSTT